MIQEIQKAVAAVCHDLFGEEVEVELSRPAEQFGDYATNAAMQLGAKLGQKPHAIAQQLAPELTSIKGVAKAEVAGPGFINLTLTDEKLAAAAASATKLPKPLAGQAIVAEYSDPNPFKILHVGHLYTSVVGDGIAKLLENAGAEVHRVNFGGDVGLHVGKTLWAAIDELGGELPEKLETIAPSQRPEWLAACYVKGNSAYENDAEAKVAAEELNKKVYRIHESGDHKSPLAQIYWECRQWSYDYFKEFYKKIGSRFDKYYPESETIGPGLAAVKANMGKVFTKSQGAVIFKGEVHNMHTRVFINSQGLPTYETKDVGLILKKWQDYHFDRSIVITGNEQAEYMAVVLAAIAQFEPDLAKKSTHITHGLVKLAGGVKMSSRQGNIIKAQEVLDVAAEANQKANGKDDPAVVLGAVKYSFLKHRIGADLVFDPQESVSLEGNSGPYLQYAHARACSILAKAKLSPLKAAKLEPAERSLARKISEYPEVVAKAAAELMPHHICTYLYELAQNFNRFYEANRVVGDPREALRASLVKSYAKVLKNGLNLLNIEAPERI